MLTMNPRCFKREAPFTSADRQRALQSIRRLGDGKASVVLNGRIYELWFDVNRYGQCTAPKTLKSGIALILLGLLEAHGLRPDFVKATHASEELLAWFESSASSACPAGQSAHTIVDAMQRTASLVLLAA